MHLRLAALAYGAPLVTRHVQDFQRIPGLVIEDGTAERERTPSASADGARRQHHECRPGCAVLRHGRRACGGITGPHEMRHTLPWP